jgi:outer membrane biosynthesis protein TonB
MPARIALALALTASLALACKKDQESKPPETADAAAPAGESDAAEPAAKEEEESPYLDVANFNRAVESHQEEIAGCYRDTAGKQPDAPTGRVKTTIVVDGDGKVKDVTFDPQRSTLKHDGLNACIKDKAKTWKFNITLNGADSPMPYTFTLP